MRNLSWKEVAFCCVVVVSIMCMWLACADKVKKYRSPESSPIDSESVIRGGALYYLLTR